MAASQDRKRPASKIPEGCKTFINYTGTVIAELDLSEQLDDLGHRNIPFSYGIILALGTSAFKNRFTEQLVGLLFFQGQATIYRTVAKVQHIGPI